MGLERLTSAGLMLCLGATGRFAASGYQEAGTDCLCDHRIVGGRRHRKRGVGWGYVSVGEGGATRMALALVMSGERVESAVAFLRFLIGRYRQMGVVVKRVITCDGLCNVPRLFRAACNELVLRHFEPARIRLEPMARRSVSSGQH